MYQNRWSHLFDYESKLKSGAPESKSVDSTAPVKLYKPSLESNEIDVPLSKILPILAQAFQQGSRWIEDLGDEPIRVQKDFLEILELAKTVQNRSRDAG